MDGRGAVEATVALESLDVRTIRDAGAREAVVRLMNLVEELAAENRTLREQNQGLRDELARLKGQSGRPSGLGGKGRARPGDTSSEKDRREPKKRETRSKLDKIVVDREETLTVDRATLPADAVRKGHEAVVVQDVRVSTDNVRFMREKWYSASTRQTYLAPMPAGYDGQFGPGLRSLVTVLYYGVGTSEPKVAELLRNLGTLISDGQVSNLLIKKQEPFHNEAAAVRRAGLASSPWQHLDVTGTTINGKAQHCHVLTNPLYAAYDTQPKKDRLAAIDVLMGGQDRRYLLNDEAVQYLVGMRLSASRLTAVQTLPWHALMDEATLAEHLAKRVPALGPNQQRWVREALAVAAYHAQTGYPVIRVLVCDDAPQFSLVTDELALCWVHEGRHYAKLAPVLAAHCQALADVRTKFWAYYRQLAAYRKAPSEPERLRLAAQFDTLFTSTTGYGALDRRIALTRAKRAQLLMVLTHPEVELHNNPAELAARRRVRKRDVSFGPRTADGAKAWDTFQTLAATAQKLNVSFYHYINDRISGSLDMPALADLITQRAASLNLAASWANS